jgi:hypothetical protein
MPGNAISPIRGNGEKNARYIAWGMTHAITK